MGGTAGHVCIAICLIFIQLLYSTCNTHIKFYHHNTSFEDRVLRSYMYIHVATGSLVLRPRRIFSGLVPCVSACETTQVLMQVKIECCIHSYRYSDDSHLGFSVAL